jgi:hypothetical protein
MKVVKIMLDLKILDFHKGSSKTHLDKLQFLVEKTSAIDLNASFENT